MRLGKRTPSKADEGGDDDFGSDGEEFGSDREEGRAGRGWPKEAYHGQKAFGKQWNVKEPTLLT
mgnify:FL=1